MDSNLKDLIETVNFIKDNMVMKSDFEELRDEVVDIRTVMATKDEVRAIVRAELEIGTADMKEDIKYIKEEIKDMLPRIETLEETVASHAGFAKEIDYLLERNTVIEKHIGLAPATA